MEKDRIKWNERYEKKDANESFSQIVERFHVHAKPDRALDIACGTGRNALFLARHGFTVDAVDISDTALEKLSGRHENIRTIRADLDTFEISANTYDLILNIRFLSRRLFPYIKEGLLPGGLLIFESYLEMFDERETESERWRPSCRDYLLRENELLHSFLFLDIRFYHERVTRESSPRAYEASLVGIKK